MLGTYFPCAKMPLATIYDDMLYITYFPYKMGKNKSSLMGDAGSHTYENAPYAQCDMAASCSLRNDILCASIPLMIYV